VIIPSAIVLWRGVVNVVVVGSLLRSSGALPSRPVSEVVDTESFDPTTTGFTGERQCPVCPAPFSRTRKHVGKGYSSAHTTFRSLCRSFALHLDSMCNFCGALESNPPSGVFELHGGLICGAVGGIQLGRRSGRSCS